jgi:hypothetical protein
MTTYIILVSLLWYYLSVPDKIKSELWLEINIIADFLFTNFEFIIFSRFMLKEIADLQVLSRILNSSFVMFSAIVVTISLFRYGKLTLPSLYILYTVQAIIILALSLAKLLDLVSKYTIIPIVKENSFWITAGVLFLSLCTLPYSILLNFQEFGAHLNPLFSLFPLFYAILFLLIIKAFLCKPVKHI